MTGDDDLPPAARLVHDVAKYVSRTARNLGDGAPPAVLVGMLARDLYESQHGGRMSQVFEARAEGLADARLDRVRACFVELDALEPGVRAGDAEAVRRAAALAREIDGQLRAYAKETR